MEKKLWNDKVLWGCRSPLGMTWNEFSWWVMGAWTHILFSFSVHIDFHIGACLLQLIHSFAEASGRKHWLKGPIPGVMWGSGKAALVWESRQASPLSFLRNSRMRAPLSTAPDIVNQKFGTLELKCNPLKLAEQTKHSQKCPCAIVHVTSWVKRILSSVAQSPVKWCTVP